MRCPNCKKQIALSSYVYRNLENYGGSVVAVSRCCNSAFNVGIVNSFSITSYMGESDVDDRGNNISKKK